MEITLGVNMKSNKSVLRVARIISLAVLLAGLLGIYAGYTKEIDILLIISIALAVLGALVLILTGVLLALPDKETKEVWQRYLALAAADKDGDNALQNFDYTAALTQIRRNYADDGDPKKNRFHISLSGVSKDFSVLGSGKIRYGCLVEANDKLFRPVRNENEVVPAVFVYSTDGYFDENPEELRDIASTVYNDRAHNFLKNEKKYFFNVRLPEEICDGKSVYATVVAVCRRHVPLGMFSGGDIVPLIADPDRNDEAFIIDARYWNEEFIVKFIKNL